MCGITGFLGPWSGALLELMGASLGHRGPDGAGTFMDEAARVGLAHRRLSIIDLSDAAAQPMTSADGRYTITFNGEIYNYRDLRRLLLQAGVRLKSESDTEVLLELYAREGAGCLGRLDGIFAFAVWDAHAQRLFVARDHLGVKPLYYAALPEGFLFASELKTLVLCPDLPRDLDGAAVADHVGFLWTAGESTMLRAVKKLRPGSMLTADRSGVRIARYWRSPLPQPGAESPPGDPAALARLIDDIVAGQMVADVEVGALLSGGVDSSAIVASMCKATEPARITTFCAAVGKPTSGADNFGDDSRYAHAVAQDLGVRLIEVPTEADLIAALPAMVWLLDEPTADFSAVQTQLLARAARENGIKVLLSGVGGDDLFTGYGRHTAALLYDRLRRITGARTLAARLLARMRPDSLRGRRLARIGALLAMDEEPMLAEAMSFSAVTADGRRRLLGEAVRSAMPADGLPVPFRESFAATRGLDPVTRLLDLELNGFMPDHNLNYADKMAMLEGVEVRVPLCAPRLVAWAMALPLADKIDLRHTKKILRASQRGRVPADVLTRPKQGFGVPMRAWLAGPARRLLEELTEPAVLGARRLFEPGAVAALKTEFFAGRADAALTLFPLMAIELWCRALDAAPAMPEPVARIVPRRAGVL